MTNSLYNSYIVEAGDDLYLVQGECEDPIQMTRDIQELLECERDNVQKALGEAKK